MARPKNTKPGKISMGDIRSMINKRAGMNVAHNFQQDPVGLILLFVEDNSQVFQWGRLWRSQDLKHQVSLIWLRR